MISGHTQLAAVIGSPVEHSRSPAIHNAAAAATGADLSYVALPVAAGDGAAAVEAMRTLGIRGLSVTMPHKADVISAVDDLTPVAAALGAVNHLTNTNGHVVGNNTDGEGFVIGLEHQGVDLSGRHVAVFGSGGAARAIVLGCALAGATVSVVARDPDRAAMAASVVAPACGADSSVASASVADASVWSHVDVAVNATPVGMASLQDSKPVEVPFGVDALGDSCVVVDIVYTPLETALLRAARERGLVAIDGLAMLAGQAAAQFEAWTGVRAPLDVMMAAARQ